jgi:hypothetical protein
MNALERFNKQLPPWLRVAGIAVGLLALAASWWFHVGPWAWTMDLQLWAMDGRYSPAVTLLFSALLCMIPSQIVCWLLLKSGLVRPVELDDADDDA